MNKWFPRIQAVIFDLDGTLLYTLDDIRNSMNPVFEQYGLPTFTLDEYRYLVGSGIREMADRAIPLERLTEPLVQDCIAGFHREYSLHWADTTHPYPGIVAALQRLHIAGLRLGVLSNKPHDFTVQIIDRMFPEHPFDEVLGASPAYPIKPDPTGARLLLTKLGATPATTLIIGDSDIDMQTARNVGAHAAGAAWGYRTVEELRTAGADLILQSPDEITYEKD